MIEDSPTLYFLAGVTASGKTELALDWAEKNSAEILSCDSVAIYQGMDVGSAKPSLEDQKRVKHYGLDLVPVIKGYDVSKYSEYAQGIIKRAYEKNSKILVVGGSGFYLKSFFSAVVDEIIVSDQIKESVSLVYDKYGLAGLLEELRKYNSAGLGEIDQANPVRVIKSLERCIASGKSILELKSLFEQKPIPYPNFIKQMCLVDRDNDNLESRIEHRTKRMLEAGLVEEVEKLMQDGLPQNYPAASSVGYRETISYLKGELSRDQLCYSIQLSTRQLVAKQRKWFRKYYPISPTIVSSSDRDIDSSFLNWFSDT